MPSAAPFSSRCYFFLALRGIEWVILEELPASVLIFGGSSGGFMATLRTLPGQCLLLPGG